MAEVVDLVHSPAHTAPLAKIRFEDGSVGHMGAPDGISVGQKLAFSSKVSLRPGNVTMLNKIPEGTPVCNVEARPGDGGKFARSGGNSAFVDTRMGDKVRTEKPIMKAGAAHKRAKARGKLYPTVSGVAMNPVDHPHGGGNHQAVHGPNSVPRTAPPGQKVGHIAPSRTGRGRVRKE